MNHKKHKKKKPLNIGVMIKGYMLFLVFIGITFLFRMLMVSINNKDLLILFSILFGIFSVFLMNHAYHNLKKEYYGKKKNNSS